MQPLEEAVQVQEEMMSLDIKDLQHSLNIAELLDDDQLVEIGYKVVEGYKEDEDSRSDWKDITDRALDLTRQIVEVKNTPWENASNVKYPSLVKAAIEFASTLLPTIIADGRVVRSVVVGQDPDSQKHLKAQRVVEHMSYQLLKESTEWEDETDKLLHMLPIFGTLFKKVYYDPLSKKPKSEVCRPDKIIVNHNILSLKEARRITHTLCVYPNELIEKMRLGLYKDIPIEELLDEDAPDLYNTPIELLEQHCYLDLDEDDYSEPYIVIVHKASNKVLRIVARFQDVQIKDKIVQRIEPEHYFVDYHFIKSMDGGFYSLGFGALLFPINNSINTILNQLIDAGTLANAGGGFIGSGFNIDQESIEVAPGVFHKVSLASGANLAQSIVPYPVREPSRVLQELLGVLIEASKDLASMNDASMGKQHTQNAPVESVLAMVEQGMKVYNSIAKRLYRSLKAEFYRIFYLNKLYLSDEEYKRVLDDPLASVDSDYNLQDKDFCPVADPTISTAAHKLATARALMQLPNLDPYESSKFYLESLQIDAARIDMLLPKPDPNAPPPPEMVKLMAETDELKSRSVRNQADAEFRTNQSQIDAQLMQSKLMGDMQQMKESIVRMEKMYADMQHNINKSQITAMKATKEADRKDAETILSDTHFQVDAALRAKELEIKDKIASKPSN